MRIFTLAFALALSLGAAASGQAQTAAAFPTQHFTLIVPYPPGGPTDTYARLLAEAMGRTLGQQIIVENIGGAGGTIGTAKVAAAAPNGYTIMVHQVGLPVGSALYPKLTYDAERDLAGIGLINYGPALIVARNGLPGGSFAEQVAWMRAPGRTVQFAHAGVGSFAHLCAVLVSDALKIKYDLIPYRGGGPALNDILAGHVDLNCASLTAGEQVRAGQIKGVALTAKARTPALPDVPTFAEQGFATLDLSTWHAMYTRAGTPPEIVAKLNAALRSALADPKVVATFERTGVAIYPVEQQTPEAAMALLRSEIKRWGDLIRTQNITPPG